MIIFILAHSRMKPKEQEISPFRSSTMAHLQPKSLGFVFYFWVLLSLSWKPLLYNSLKERVGGLSIRDSDREGAGYGEPGAGDCK
jgi:hypothetical protein